MYRQLARRACEAGMPKSAELQATCESADAKTAFPWKDTVAVFAPNGRAITLLRQV